MTQLARFQKRIYDMIPLSEALGVELVSYDGHALPPVYLSQYVRQMGHGHLSIQRVTDPVNHKRRAVDINL